MEGEKNSGTILVVDDDESVRRVLEAMLAKAGYAVLLASDGQRAIEVMEKEGARIILIISDGEMPQMDGPSLFAAVAQRWPDVPRLLLSGCATMLQRCPPGTSYLAKPFPLAALLKMISDLVSSRKTVAQALD